MTNPSRVFPLPGIIPLLLFPAVILCFRPRLEPWAFMLLLATGIYAGAKWLVFWRAREAFRSFSIVRSVGFLLAWPGMDPAPFVARTPHAGKPALGEWLAAALKIIAGIVLIWQVARLLVVHENALYADWCGFLGGLLFFHFGLFHLMSLLWRIAGIDARPVMRTPLLSSSLTDFWGKRWNTAFHDLAHDLIFNPARRLFGLRSALLLTFLASGLIHELVISVPARGGYGLPTLYFLLQGAGILAERSAMGKQLGGGAGIRGWLFVMIAVLAPAYILFHPRFMTGVIHPLLLAIHAL